MKRLLMLIVVVLLAGMMMGFISRDKEKKISSKQSKEMSYITKEGEYLVLYDKITEALKNGRTKLTPELESYIVTANTLYGELDEGTKKGPTVTSLPLFCWACCCTTCSWFQLMGCWYWVPHNCPDFCPSCQNETTYIGVDFCSAGGCTP